MGEGEGFSTLLHRRTNRDPEVLDSFSRLTQLNRTETALLTSSVFLNRIHFINIYVVQFSSVKSDCNLD